MSPNEDAVQRQVRAYNTRDLETFVACYAEAVIVEDAEGTAVTSGANRVRHSHLRLLGSGRASLGVESTRRPAPG
jgi:hypothetical protein